MSSVLARAVVVLGGDSHELDKVLSTAEGKMMKVGARMGEIGETLTHKVTLPLVALGTLAVYSFGEQQDALAKMNGVLAASGNAAGVTGEHLQSLAEALQQTTTFEDDVTEAAMGSLLAFQNVRNEAGKGNDVFDRTVKVAQDLSMLMGKDLQGAMFALGKTMENPEEGMMLLRRSGIILTDQVKQQIKTLGEQGNVLEEQKLVLDAVEGKVKDLAQTMAQTPLGQFQVAWHGIHDAIEEVGEVLARALIPGMKHAQHLADAFRGLSDTTKTTIVVIGSLVAALGPLLVTLGFVIKALSTISAIIGFQTVVAFFSLAKGVTTAGDALALLQIALASPLGVAVLVVAALASLTAAGFAVADNWAWLKQQSVALWAFIKDIFYKGIDSVLGAVQTLLSGLGVAGEFLQKLPGPLGAFGSALSTLATPLDAAAGGVQTMRDSLASMHDADLAGTNNLLAGFQDEILGTAAAVTVASAAVDKATKPRPPAWAGPVATALDELQKSLQSVGQQDAVLGRQFDESSAQASVYQKAVEAIGQTHVGLNVALDKTGVTLADLIRKTQALENASTGDKLVQSLRDASVEASVLGQQFDLVGARASAYESAVTELIGRHVGLDTVIGKTGKTLRQLILEMQKAQGLTVSNQLELSLSAASMQAKILGKQFDLTGAQLEAYQSAVSDLISKHVSLDTVVGDTGKTLGQLIQKVADLENAAAGDQLTKALADADAQASVLGQQFDLVGARAGAYEGAVSSLIARHVDLDTVIGDTGKTLRQLIADMQQAKLEQIGKSLADSLNAANIMESQLGAEFDATSARVSAYEAAIQSAIAAHVELNQVVEGTGMTLAELIQHFADLQKAALVATELRKVFTDLGDYLVDFAFGVKQSFGDFVRGMLMEITKLIVKMLILKALKDAFGPDSSGNVGAIGKLLGFADGGFLPPGQIGLVGERGPELVMSGNQGLRITPMPAMRAITPAEAASGSGSSVRVDLTVNAIDSRGVAQFFEENESLVAGAMLRAHQRSAALQRRLGGG